MAIKWFIRLFAYVFIVIFTIAADAQEYSYISPFGSELVVSVSSSSYEVKSGDVTQVVKACDLDKNKVCLISDNLDVVIPKVPFAVGQSWIEQGTTFDVVHRLENLSLLNKTYNNVYYISVSKNLDYYLGVNKVKKFELIYTADCGLIAFRLLSEKYQFPFQFVKGVAGLGR
ncbi:hypothetical protein [Zhongshania marina]|uniref:Uncharacterized protein n=1 Tax=Zhongshania marina TaxID=2304603 RepID=A0A2S4HC57_9GAMM|nr:hypothetical protein [Marortus luteolus]POP51519.1 hypothetical protein C0068_16405 [Marortus luteolus]